MGRRFRREYKKGEGASGRITEKSKELQKRLQKRGKSFKRVYRKGERASGGCTEKGKELQEGVKKRGRSIRKWSARRGNTATQKRESSFGR